MAAGRLFCLFSRLPSHFINLMHNLVPAGKASAIGVTANSWFLTMSILTVNSLISTLDIRVRQTGADT